MGEYILGSQGLSAIIQYNPEHFLSFLDTSSVLNIPLVHQATNQYLGSTMRKRFGTAGHMLHYDPLTVVRSEDELERYFDLFPKPSGIYIDAFTTDGNRTTFRRLVQMALDRFRHIYTHSVFVPTITLLHAWISCKSLRGDKNRDSGGNIRPSDLLSDHVQIRLINSALGCGDDCVCPYEKIYFVLDIDTRYVKTWWSWKPEQRTTDNIGGSDYLQQHPDHNWYHSKTSYTLEF